MTTTTKPETPPAADKTQPIVPAPKPLDWHSVALVAFAGDKPVMISSCEPHVLLETFIAHANETSADDDFDDDEDFADKAERMREFVKNWRWDLYSLEDAKAVFFAGDGK